MHNLVIAQYSRFNNTRFDNEIKTEMIIKILYNWNGLDPCRTKLKKKIFWYEN